MNVLLNKSWIASFRFPSVWRGAILALVLVGLTISVRMAFSQPDPSIFDERRFTPQDTPTPQAEQTPKPSKPIPRGWIIAGLTIVVVTSGVLLVKSTRAWRASNLFDRQYRFPEPGPPALRFGGTRCGGEMATLNFRTSRET